MTINYKALADLDPGGTLESAYDTLAVAETTSSDHVQMVTDLSIAASIGLNDTVAFLAGLDTAVDDLVLPSIVVEWLTTNGGIDVNHQDSQTTLQSLATANYVEQTTVDAVIAMGENSELDFPNLKIGHLANARQMRAEGRV